MASHRPRRVSAHQGTRTTTDQPEEMVHIDVALKPETIRRPPDKWSLRLTVEVDADPEVAEWRLWFAAAQAIVTTWDDNHGHTRRDIGNPDRLWVDDPEVVDPADLEHADTEATRRRPD